MDWSKISYDDKVVAITNILEEIAYDDMTFAGFKAILSVEPKPSERYLDSCYEVISSLLKSSRESQSLASEQLHEKLLKREQELRKKEAKEQQDNNTEDILQQL